MLPEILTIPQDGEFMSVENITRDDALSISVGSNDRNGAWHQGAIASGLLTPGKVVHLRDCQTHILSLFHFRRLLEEAKADTARKALASRKSVDLWPPPPEAAPAPMDAIPGIGPKGPRRVAAGRRKSIPAVPGRAPGGPVDANDGTEALLTVTQLAHAVKVSPSQIRILSLTNKIPYVCLPTTGNGLKTRRRYRLHDVLTVFNSRAGRV